MNSDYFFVIFLQFGFFDDSAFCTITAWGTITRIAASVFFFAIYIFSYFHFLFIFFLHKWKYWK